MSPIRLQSRGFRKPAPPPKLRDQDRDPQKLARDDVSFVGGVSGAVPKTEPKRNRALLDLARGEACLLRVPGVCNGDWRTTVACHSNLGIHGKAGARKADDQYSVWGCSACHFWLDQGPALAPEKERVFMKAHLLQVEIWREMAFDPFQTNHDTPKQRQAARWALDQLGATPVGAMGC